MNEDCQGVRPCGVIAFDGPRLVRLIRAKDALGLYQTIVW
jgi:hypothetical protein